MKITFENKKLKLEHWTDTSELERLLRKHLDAPRDLDHTEEFALRYVLHFLFDRVNAWHERAELLDLDVDDLEEFEAVNDFVFSVDDCQEKDFEKCIWLSIPGNCETRYILNIYYDYNKARYLFINEGI